MEKGGGDVKEGDLVVVKNDLLIPNEWRLGRITKVHQGASEKIRVVDTRMKFK